MDSFRQTATKGATLHTEDAYTPLQQQPPSPDSCPLVLSVASHTGRLATAARATHDSTLRARVLADVLGVAISSSPDDQMELLLRKKLSRFYSGKTSQATHPSREQNNPRAKTLFDLWIEHFSAHPKAPRKRRHNYQDHPNYLQKDRPMNRKIKSMLVARGIKQKDIADHLGISLAAVSGAINGHHKSRRIMEYVAQLLNADYQKLWGKAA